MSAPLLEAEKLTRRRVMLDGYVRKLHNPLKRAYAERFVAWVLRGRRGSEPEYGELSFMGAQAVRLAVNEISPEEKR